VWVKNRLWDYKITKMWEANHSVEGLTANLPHARLERAGIAVQGRLAAEVGVEDA
jgi:hypothetical protein